MKYIKNRESFKLILEKGEDGFYNDTLWDNSLVGRIWNWAGFKAKNQVKKGMFKVYLNDIEKALNAIIMDNIKDDDSVKVDNIYSTIYGIKKWIESQKEIDLQQLMIMIQDSMDKLQGYKEDESYKSLIEDIDKILQKFEDFKDALENLAKTEFKEDIKLEMDKDALKRLDDDKKAYDNKIQELNDTLKDVKTGFQLASKSIDDLDRVFMDEPEKKKAFLSAYRTILTALGLSNRLTKSKAEPDTSSIDNINNNIIDLLKKTVRQGDKVEWVSKKGNIVKGVIARTNTNGGKGIQISYDKDKVVDVTYTGISNNKTFKLNGKLVTSLTESFIINEAVALSLTDSIAAIQNFFDILKRLPQLKDWENELQNDIKKIIGMEIPTEPTKRETVDSEVVKKTVDKIVENIDFDEVLINEEKAKELIAKSEEMSRQNNTEKTKESAIDIVKVFNRVSRLMLKNDSYMNSKPRMQRYYTKIDGTTMWRNNELFENWNDGVLSILGKYGYKTGSKPIPKAVVDFIIDMLDDSRLINKGHQQAYLRKHFNISEDDAKKFTNYDKGGRYDTEKDDDGESDSLRSDTKDKTLEYSEVKVLDITGKNFSKVSFAVTGDLNAKSMTEGENSNIKRGARPIVCYVVGILPNTGHLVVKFKVDNKDYIERYVKADGKNITDEKFSNNKKDQIFFGFMPNKIKIKKDGRDFKIRYCRIEEIDSSNPNVCEVSISPKEVYLLTGNSDGFMYNFTKKVDSSSLIDNDKIVKIDTALNNLWEKFKPKDDKENI